MKTTMLALAALGVLALPAAARQDPARGEALRKLETMKISVDFSAATLTHAVDYFREVTGLNFVIKPSASAADAPVTLKLKDVSVRSALRLLLKPRGLSATWKEGAVVVGPEGEVQETFALRMYDVRDTIVKIQDFPGPVIELKMGDKDAGIVVSYLEEPRQPIPPDFIVEMIRENTGGRSWEDPRASASHVNGMLVVSQSAAVHREIAALLARLGQYR